MAGADEEEEEEEEERGGEGGGGERTRRRSRSRRRREGGRSVELGIRDGDSVEIRVPKWHAGHAGRKRRRVLGFGDVCAATHAVKHNSAVGPSTSPSTSTASKNTRSIAL